LIFRDKFDYQTHTSRLALPSNNAISDLKNKIDLIQDEQIHSKQKPIRHLFIYFLFSKSPLPILLEKMIRLPTYTAAVPQTGNGPALS